MIEQTALHKALRAQEPRWCILRTSGARTLPLARSLAAAGFEVWTPIEAQSRRQPRTTKWHDVEAPIMPTFVFARADHLVDLVQLLAQPIHRHPSFSIFLHSGRAPLIADRSMDHLRDAEDRSRRLAEQRAKAKASKQRRDIPIGQSVKVKDDANFLGLVGVVEGCNGKKAIVNFPGWRRSIEIDTWQLLPDAVLSAAKAA